MVLPVVGKLSILIAHTGNCLKNGFKTGEQEVRDSDFEGHSAVTCRAPILRRCFDSG